MKLFPSCDFVPSKCTAAQYLEDFYTRKNMLPFFSQDDNVDTFLQDVGDIIKENDIAVDGLSGPLPFYYRNTYYCVKGAGIAATAFTSPLLQLLRDDSIKKCIIDNATLFNGMATKEILLKFVDNNIAVRLSWIQFIAYQCICNHSKKNTQQWEKAVHPLKKAAVSQFVKSIKAMQTVETPPKRKKL